MRVMHVLRQLNPGGIECWLERLVRHWPAASRPEFHFALEEREFGNLAPRLESLGVRLHHCPAPRDPWRFVRSLRDLLMQHGPFDALHCHTHYASPMALAVAAWAGIPQRLAHSHADYRRAAKSIGRKIYAESSRWMLAQLATGRIAVSQAAARDLFGTAEQVQVMPCGIAWQDFLETKPKRDPSRFTLIHTGRLVPEKNHAWLLRLTAAIRQECPQVRLWLVGDGPLRQDLERRAAERGVQDCVKFWGNRRDVADLLAAADLFVFPSHAEGLGLAAIEAQACGLPVLVAEHLPREIDVFPELVRRLAIDLPIEDWAMTALSMRTISPLPSALRHERLAHSSISIESNIRILSEIYAG